LHPNSSGTPKCTALSASDLLTYRQLQLSIDSLLAIV
jgi:hypothetical protein